MTTDNNINIDIDPDDPRNIWVSPDDADDSPDDSDGTGIGTYERPFASIPPALKKAALGQRVVLLPGTYRGDLTIEISGSENAPVYITAYKTGEAIINGCWYFYDTSDLVVSGLTFKNTRHGSIYVVGECLRNRFHGINFVDGAAEGNASCALFFGGAGGRFNLVEDCVFSRVAGAGAGNGDGDERRRVVEPYAREIVLFEKSLFGRSVVGIMVSDGSYFKTSGQSNSLTNHIFRRNRFSGYDISIIMGESHTPDSDSGHIVEFNTIENCASDGITVRCGDVQIRGNIINGCASAGIDLSSGDVSTVEGNRISGCGSGISVRGADHTVAGNHIVGCKSAAVVAESFCIDGSPAENLYAYDNHFVNCGTDAGASAVIVKSGTSGVVQNNKFYGQTLAYSLSSENKNFVIADNAEGISIDEYVDDGVDVFIDDGIDEDDGYVEASIPDDVDDGDDVDSHDDADEQEEIINFMFGREGWD